jgi:hypothetical protein
MRNFVGWKSFQLYHYIFIFTIALIVGICILKYKRILLFYTHLYLFQGVEKLMIFFLCTLPLWAAEKCVIALQVEGMT